LHLNINLKFGMMIKNLVKAKLISLSTTILFQFNTFAQNNIDNYLSINPIQTIIANANNGVKAPRDIDFNPKIVNQVWVPNFGTLTQAGSMVIISNAGAANQAVEVKTDPDEFINHFFNSPSAISFSNNGNFATCGELENSPGDTKYYMGPVLWPSSTFGKESPNGSSHIDMLHESPYAMGIEAEKDNIFWLFDGFNGMICKYNFHNPHAPGEFDHSDGELIRYSEIKVLRKNGVPSHLVRDKATNWLYIVDGGNKRILRMDIASGQKDATLKCNEPYQNGCYSMKNVKWEVVVSSGLIDPSGIEVKNNRMMVSDNSSGDIIVYNISTGKGVEMGRIKTQSGIMGIKLSGDNKIWYVNNKLNQVVRLDYGVVAGNSGSEIQQVFFNLFPNPATNICTIKYTAADAAQVRIVLYNIMGKEIKTMKEGNFSTIDESVDIADMPTGLYIVGLVLNGVPTTTRKLEVK
jgi:hypothetical protein